MKTIKEINKAFDEECPTHVSLGKGSFVILRSEAENIRIKEFWNKQILSLIEELEGKMPKKIEKPKYDGQPNDIQQIIDFQGRDNRIWGYNKAIDQMRASIRGFKEKL